MDDPVAVMPRGSPLAVGFKPHRLSPTNDIEPMLRPAFAVARRSEQCIDRLRKKRIRGALVLRECLHSFRRR